MSRLPKIGSLVLSLVALACLAPQAQAQLVNISFTGAEPSGPNRVFRDAVPSVAGSPKVFPGIFANSSTFFFTQAVTVGVGETITITQNTGGTNIFLALYRDSINPASLATNYAADAGSSVDNGVFGFTNAGGSTSFLAVAMNTTSQTAGTVTGTTGSFTMSVTGAATAPEPGTLALLALGGVALVKRRRK